MKIPFLSLLLWVVLAGAAPTALAEKADRNKPMNIEADALRYDDLKQSSVFTGNVVVTKGTIQIRGMQIAVRQDPAGNQFGVVTGAASKLAFFRQKREGLDEFIEGEAEIIEYDSKADTVKFIKNAQLRRYRGATLADEITGGLIVYENNTELFSVDGAIKGVAGAPAGRVRAMLTPKPEGASTPPPSAGTVTPALRPSTTLEGAPQ